MQRFLSLALALCIGLSFSLDADARRFGGGKSFGSAPSHQPRQAPAQNPAAAPARGNQGAAAANSGASRWLGPLAGLAAGGLLASMFMGDGFQGIQFMDILVFGLLAFFLFRLFARRRQMQPAGAQGSGAPVAQQSPFQTGFATRSSARPVVNAPAWFNEQTFLQAAQEHFLALQQHWDANEMEQIAEFVTPQMLDFLKRERESLGEGFQSTYIDDLAIELDGVDDNADKTIATLTFTGTAKTSRFDQGEFFSESWRMEREQGEGKPWLIAGIRQNPL